MKKTQALLFVLFLLVLIVVLVAGLFFIVKQETKRQKRQQYSLAAFYLAHAGLEKAKIDTLSNYWMDGTYYFPGPNSTDWSDSLDQNLADSYDYQYKYILENPSGGSDDQREITAEGRIAKGTNVLASKKIEVTLEGIRDDLPNNPPPNPDGDGVDDDQTGSVVSESWRQK
ncbi:MAG: hypothetical protein K9L84_03595 [Candidatus Omnitrophica bacterium]|nr:hypothetical protein [Candidatus Omnitrophota bacterium]MCF7894123.1 hypothetical protein [Candidatus Omnitrophota bacterium]